jgi:hypothetical protein
VIPVFSRRLSMAADCGFCAVFKDREEACRRPGVAHCGRPRDGPFRASAGGRRSLKTQQHAGRFDASRLPPREVGRADDEHEGPGQVRSTC